MQVYISYSMNSSKKTLFYLQGKFGVELEFWYQVSPRLEAPGLRTDVVIEYSALDWKFHCLVLDCKPFCKFNAVVAELVDIKHYRNAGHESNDNTDGYKI